MIYPSYDFKEQQNNAVKNQQSILDEASEHFELLKALAITDAEYQSYLKLCKNRKTEVNDTLKTCKIWSNFLKDIASSK